MNMFLIAAAVAAIAAPLSSNGQELTGSQVTAAVYCCTEPIESNRGSTISSSTVGQQVEFPNGTFQPITGQGVIPVAIDVGATTIDIKFTENSLAASGTFNGYALDFQGAPEILGLSLNSLSTFSPVSFSYDADSIFINNASLSFTPQSFLLLDVVTAVPEPQTYAMILAGISILSFQRWRRSRQKNCGRDNAKKHA